MILPTGLGVDFTGGAAGKIRGVGQADLVAAAGNGKTAQIRAYTRQAGLQAVAGNVFQGGSVGQGLDFDAGNGAAAVFGTKQYTQGAATAAKIQDTGIFWQADKIRQ